MPFAPGEIIKDRYRIEELLGKGGYGAVYRAWDIKGEKPVAVKESLDISESGHEQFKLEAELLAKLEHRSLPRVNDYFTIDMHGQYLVLDYIEGQDAESILRRTGKPLPEAHVVSWIAQVCDALTYLHSQQPPVIHRDIKPANIRITPQGQVILVDFGIAKVFDPEISTMTGARAVTPGYSPPEQFGLGKTDAMSDVFALAATAYHLLTGQIPATSMDIMAGTVKPNPPVHTVNSAVSIAVSEAIERAMEPSRSIRLGSAAEFNAAILAGAADSANQNQKALFSPQSEKTTSSYVQQHNDEKIPRHLLRRILSALTDVFKNL